MENEIRKRFDTGRVRVTFEGEGRDVIASCSFDPTDTGLLSRAEEVASFFSSGMEDSLDDARALSDLIEEKICYMLGYDAREELFGRVSATTISPDGELFAFAVLDTISCAMGAELESRGAALRERVGHYTAKYQGK